MKKLSFMNVSNFSKITMSVIYIILIFIAYRYLDNLKNCDCVNLKSVENMKDSEIVLLGLAIFGLIIKIYKIIRKKEKIMELSIHFRVITVAMIIGIFIYFLNNFYTFFKTLPETCKCSDTFDKNVLYLQSLYYSIDLILIIILIFGIFFI